MKHWWMTATPPWEVQTRAYGAVLLLFVAVIEAFRTHWHMAGVYLLAAFLAREAFVCWRGLWRANQAADELKEALEAKKLAHVQATLARARMINES